MLVGIAESLPSIPIRMSESDKESPQFFVGFYNLLHCFNEVIDLDPKSGEEIVVASRSSFQLASGGTNAQVDGDESGTAR